MEGNAECRRSWLSALMKGNAISKEKIDTALIVNIIIISRKTCMTVSGRYMDDIIDLRV